MRSVVGGFDSFVRKVQTALMFFMVYGFASNGSWYALTKAMAVADVKNESQRQKFDRNVNDPVKNIINTNKFLSDLWMDFTSERIKFTSLSASFCFSVEFIESLRVKRPKIKSIKIS